MAKDKEFTFDEGDDDFSSPDPLPTPPIKPPSGGGKKGALLLLLIILGGAGAYFYLYGIPGMEAEPVKPAPVSVKVPVAPVPKPAAPVAVAAKPAAPPATTTVPAATPGAAKPAATPAPTAVAPAKPAAATTPAASAATVASKAVPAPAPVAAAKPAATTALKAAPPPAVKPVKEPAEVVAEEKPQPGSFVYNAGAFLVKANLIDAERRVRRLGFEPRRTTVKRPVAMTRLRVGVYPPQEAAARYHDLVAGYPSAFTLKQGDKVALYAASFHDLNQARSFADQLYLDGIHVEEEQTEVPMKMTVLTFGNFPDKAEAEKELKRIRAAGLRDVKVTVTK